MTKDLLGKDYYSLESAKAYWSVSQVKRFKECEARALAELNDDWKDNRDKTALLVGNYVHSAFESKEAHEAFIDENKESIFKKNGSLYVPFETAENMISALATDKNFVALYQGEKEAAITGEIADVEFKGKIDCLNVEHGYFVDIKTTKGPIDDEVWVKDKDGNNYKVRWFEAYGYILQMAVYKTMLEAKYNKPFEPIIYAVTKESPSDTRAIRIQNIDAIQDELNELAKIIKHLDDVKHGRAQAKPCGHCEYCREKRLTKRVEVY